MSEVLSAEQAKAKVMERYPDAECFGPLIYVRPGIPKPPNYEVLSEKAEARLGYGETEDAAWISAASSLPEKKDGKPDGVSLIAAERKRQVESEGWTPEHDDEHFMGEMIGAAVTYAAHALEIVTDNEVPGADNEGWWPDSWHQDWWKPSPNPIRNLVKAGALIAAEIDRLQRKGVK